MLSQGAATTVSSGIANFGRNSEKKERLGCLPVPATFIGSTKIGVISSVVKTGRGGYGFIHINSGSKPDRNAPRIFFAMRQVANSAFPVRRGRSVSFDIRTDNLGRPCACNVVQATEENGSNYLRQRMKESLLVKRLASREPTIVTIPPNQMPIKFEFEDSIKSHTIMPHLQLAASAVENIYKSPQLFASTFDEFGKQFFDAAGTSWKSIPNYSSALRTALCGGGKTTVVKVRCVDKKNVYTAFNSTDASVFVNIKLFAEMIILGFSVNSTFVLLFVVLLHEMCQAHVCALNDFSLHDNAFNRDDRVNWLSPQGIGFPDGVHDYDCGAALEHILLGGPIEVCKSNADGMLCLCVRCLIDPTTTRSAKAESNIVRRIVPEEVITSVAMHLQKLARGDTRTIRRVAPKDALGIIFSPLKLHVLSNDIEGTPLDRVSLFSRKPHTITTAVANDPFMRLASSGSLWVKYRFIMARDIFTDIFPSADIGYNDGEK